MEQKSVKFLYLSAYVSSFLMISGAVNSLNSDALALAQTDGYGIVQAASIARNTPY